MLGNKINRLLPSPLQLSSEREQMLSVDSSTQYQLTQQILNASTQNAACSLLQSPELTGAQARQKHRGYNSPGNNPQWKAGRNWYSNARAHLSTHGKTLRQIGQCLSELPVELRPSCL